MNRRDMDIHIRDAAYMQANLEARQADFYEKNEYLEGENKEIGVFREDGNVIRRNMDRLKDEVEGLRTKHKDAVSTQRELEIENERLKKLLKDLEGKDKNPKFLSSFQIKV